MTLQESVRAYKAAGLAARYHRWARKDFIQNMQALLDQLKADESLEPRARFGLDEKGVLTLWHYAAPTGVQVAEDGDDCDGGFNVSHPCPPHC